MDEIPDGIAIIPGATSPVADYQFFQSNDFLYFTGVEAPDAWLVVDGVNRESTLFLTLDEHDARGDGIPAELALNPEGFTGIEHALPVEELDTFLEEIGRRFGVFYLSQRPEELHRMNTNEVHGAFQRTVTDNPMDGRLTRELQLVTRLEQRYPHVEVRDCFRTIQVLRKVKSPAEVALTREASQIGVRAHLEFMRSTEVGMPEKALAALFEFVSKREGAQELAYETIIMAGDHHPWGHYHRHSSFSTPARTTRTTTQTFPPRSRPMAPSRPSRESSTSWGSGSGRCASTTTVRGPRSTRSVRRFRSGSSRMDMMTPKTGSAGSSGGVAITTRSGWQLTM
jgi:Xaa-Pro aminopeptidase